MKIREWALKDTIVGSDRRIFQNVAVRDLSHNSDHLMVLGCLNRNYLMEHFRYLGRRTRLPLRPPGCQTRMQAKNIFSELRRAVSKPDKQAAHHNSWILSEMCRIVDERVSTRREPGRDQWRIRLLGRAIWAALKEDRRRQAETAGEDVERLLSGDPPLPCKSWRRMRGCYRVAVDHALPPA